MSTKLDMLSAKFGIDKFRLSKILEQLVLEKLKSLTHYYSEKASIDELMDFLEANLTEEQIYDKISEEL